MTNDEVHAFLDSRPGWISLTTISKDGFPHTVPIGYFRMGNEVYIGCRAGTQKLKNIERNPKVSAMLESGSTMQDIKGVYPVEVIKHNIGQGGFSAREWQTIMAWADVGKLAVFFHNNSSSETCIDNYWYQTNTGGEWWTLTHAEPFFLRTFAGRPEKLATVVAAMVAGMYAHRWFEQRRGI